MGASGTRYIGVVEVRRRPKSVSNAIKAPQNMFITPRGRDVLLYPDRATFYNPVHSRDPSVGKASPNRQQLRGLVFHTWALDISIIMLIWCILVRFIYFLRHFKVF